MADSPPADNAAAAPPGAPTTAAATGRAGPGASPTDILLLHPGAMGSAVGEVWHGLGLRVHWLPEGRSAASSRRAEAAGLLGTDLDTALGRCTLVASICPPHAALTVAAQVFERGYRGLYLDANAISPQASASIAELASRAGAQYVDGGIIGPPPRGNATARLYLSGPHAAELAPRLAGAGLSTQALAGGLCQASALKMAFAAWNKGAQALLADVHALADTHGVREALEAEWALLEPDAAERTRRMLTNAPKAWRWSGEMREIADTFGAAGLPEGFHRAAAEVYDRLAGFKDAAEPPPLAGIVAALRRAGG